MAHSSGGRLAGRPVGGGTSHRKNAPFLYFHTTRDTTGKGFDTFFWDGRVDFSGNRRLSQFGANPPSDDSLVTAAHLPVVQIREMLDEDDFVKKHKRESVERAAAVYKAIADNLRRAEPAASRDLAGALGKPLDRLTYTDYARSI